MTKLTWGAVGERFFELGVDRGVLYVEGQPGVAWNGLASLEENPSGGDAKPFYLDGVKYLNLSAKEEFEGTINAFYSPPEFDVCDGLGLVQPGLFAAQQRRKSFGLSYRTKIGNDLDSDDHAYKIHIIYNASAEPTQHSYASIGDKNEASLLAWAISTKPVLIPAVGYSAHLIIDSSKATTYGLQTLEDILYGDDVNIPRLPTVTELSNIFKDSLPIVVTDIGNNQFTISGSGFAVMLIDVDQYQITSDVAIIFADGSAQISSE